MFIDLYDAKVNHYLSKWVYSADDKLIIFYFSQKRGFYFMQIALNVKTSFLEKKSENKKKKTKKKKQQPKKQNIMSAENFT